MLEVKFYIYLNRRVFIMVYPGLSVFIIRSITVKSIIPDSAIVLKETDTLLGMIASY